MKKATMTATTTPRSFTAKSLAEYEGTKAYRDQRIAWVVATRGWYPCEVVDSWETITWPMNQFRSVRITAKGMEVAAAYNQLVRLVTDKKMALENFGSYAQYVLSAKFILTTEEDNIIPPDAVMKMLAAIYTCPDCGKEIGTCCADKKAKCQNCREWRCPKGHKGYDGVSGLYSVKTSPPVPMAFGHPRDPNDFKPRSVAKAVATGKVIEVNGIAMGCALWRKDAFKAVSKPLFDTGDTYTQDIYYCKKAKKEIGARFGVHCGIAVGHLDVNTGEII